MSTRVCLQTKGLDIGATLKYILVTGCHLYRSMCLRANQTCFEHVELLFWNTDTTAIVLL